MENNAYTVENTYTENIHIDNTCFIENMHSVDNPYIEHEFRKYMGTNMSEYISYPLYIERVHIENTKTEQAYRENIT